MKNKNEWDTFFHEKARKIFTEKSDIIDIGGTLGIDENRCDRTKSYNQWLTTYLDKVDYKVLDKVPDYNPDIVGDIHDLPLEDNSVEAMFCCSVIEHVENPIKAVEEVHRVLQKDGYAFFYAPFLFYYHPREGYYKDYYRFTYDGWEYLTRQFSKVEISPTNGPLATAVNLFPFMTKRVGWLKPIDRWLKPNSRQVSGYNVFCVK